MWLVHQTVCFFPLVIRKIVFFLCISYSHVIASINRKYGTDVAVWEAKWHNARSLGLNYWWLESSYFVCIINACKKVWTLPGTRSWPVLSKTATLSPSLQPMVPFQPQILADCLLQLGYPSLLKAADCLLQLGYFSLPSGSSTLFWPPVFLMGEEEWNEKVHFGKTVMRKEMSLYVTNEHAPQMLRYASPGTTLLPILITWKYEANPILDGPGRKHQIRNFCYNTSIKKGAPCLKCRKRISFKV